MGRNRLVHRPQPGYERNQNNVFYGVSCTSATDCTAVGGAVGATAFQTLIEEWDGTAWSIVPSPDTSTSQTNYLQAVSCTSATSCNAVGQARGASAYQTLVEEWDGTDWSIVASPDTSVNQYNDLTSISCLSATA